LFINLIINAAQAFEKEEKLDNRIEVSLSSESESAVVEIADNGCGMSPETVERIFDPFFTTKGMSRGTGLGLASVYGIVRNHGGTITVTSKKGKGSTFSIYLPASRRKAMRENRGSDTLVPGKETVLLVDDEDMILEVGTQILEKMGHKVLKAKSGQEATELYQMHKDSIDLVILDMIMPGMSGGETYDRIKAIDPEAKVLLSSGYSVDGQATEILKRGCNGFIQKPFRMKDLSHKIQEVLGKG